MWVPNPVPISSTIKTCLGSYECLSIDQSLYFLENFKKSSSYLNQTKDFVQRQILEIENRLTIFNPDHKVLSKEKLSKESDFVKFEILKKYGFNQEVEIQKIFKAENGSSFFSKDYQLIVNLDELILEETQKFNFMSYIDNKIRNHLNFNQNILLFEKNKKINFLKFTIRFCKIRI